MSNIIYNENCLDGINKIENNSVDLFFCDPPYNASVSKPLIWAEKSFKKINEEWDKIENLEEFNEQWITKIIPKMKEGGVLYITCSFHNLNSLLNVLKKTSLKFRNIITWFKPNAMPMQSANMGYFAYSCEYILFFSKGKIKERWNYNWMKEQNKGIQQRDLLVFKVCQDEKTGHPTQKPLKLLEYLIQTCTKEKELVCDIFMGSGTTAIASLNLNRKFIGFEKEKKYCEIIEKRIKRFKEVKKLEEVKE